MRLHEFTDSSKYCPSKIETAKTEERTERNPHHNIEDDATRRQAKIAQSKKIEP